MITVRELTNQLAALYRKETAAMADFLVALADFDRHERWRELGHTSLFYFLRRELELSAGAAQARKTAAELIQRVPEVEAALREGKLCLTTINELAKVLTPENRAEVLPRFFGLSRREAEELAVSIRPVPVVPARDVIIAIRPAPAATVATPATAPHAEPDAAVSFRLDETVMTSVNRDEPAATPSPAASPTPSPQRAVHERAGGRCECLLESGERCGSTWQLEYDHVVARARGGKSTVENVRLACRAHNVAAARRVFGDSVMDRYTRVGRSTSRAQRVPSTPASRATVSASPPPP